MTEYKITKEQCEAGISGVCPGCGGEVTAIETEDNSRAPTFWSGCMECGVFTRGVPLKIHKISRLLVLQGTLVPYSDTVGSSNRTAEQYEYWLRTNTREAAVVVKRTQWFLDNIPEGAE